MAKSKQILVVDDHFEMLEFLRSMLELSHSDYHVVGVPSGEEGLLELHRTPFDLLISDVRLPGMSGFELVRKARALRTELPALMITAYASAQGRQEADQLGVYRYFEKPLDTDALLAAVHTLLYPEGGAHRTGDTAPFTAQEPGATAATVKGQPRAESGGAAAERKEPAGKAERTAREAQADQEDVTPRLRALLSDTGAVGVMLANAEGRILYRVGGGEQPLAQLARLLARSLVDSFELAEALDSAEPFTIQYQAGERVDLYSANIGRHHFLVLLFDARARRGRIGTVWVFAQRAIKELRELLPADRPGEDVMATADAPEGDGKVAGAGMAVRAESQRRVTGREQSSNRVGDADDAAHGADDAAHGDLFDLLEDLEAGGELDLDTFWEEATAEAGKAGGPGLSYEEAVRRGLLPPDLSE